MARSAATGRKKKTPKVGAAEGKKKAQKPVAPPPPVNEESEDSSSEEDEETMPVAGIKGGKPTAPAPVAEDSEDSDDDEDDDDDDDDDAPKPAQKSPAKPNGKEKAPVQEESEDDSEEEDSDEEEEEEATPQKAAVKPKVTDPEPMEEDDDDEDEDEDDDDDDEDDEDDDEDDDESSEEEEEDNEEGAGEGQKKRKKAQAKKSSKKKKVLVQLTVFVKNLPKQSTAEEVQTFFEATGAKIKEVRKMPKKKMGFLVLEDKDEYPLVEAMNGEDFKGKSLVIKLPDDETGTTPPSDLAKAEKGKKKAEKKEEKKTEQPKKNDELNEIDACVLVIRNLARSVTEKTLRDTFPTVQTVRMPVNNDKQCRGFAFLSFDTPEAAKSVMEEDDGIEVDGQNISLGPYQTRPPGKTSAVAPQAGTTKVLFISNLLYETTKETIQEHFDTAKEVRLMTFPESGKSRGFGFVEFETPTEAAKAHAKYAGTEIEGRAIKVDYAQERGGGGNRNRGAGFRGGFRGRGGGGGFRGRGGGGGGGGWGGGRGGGFRGGRGGGGFRGGRGRGGGGGFGGGQGKRKTFDD